MERGTLQVIATTLRRHRVAHGMTLQVMADRAGFSKGHLSQVETGKETPSLKLISAYESALGLAEGTIMSIARASDEVSESVIRLQGARAGEIGGGEDEDLESEDYEDNQRKIIDRSDTSTPIDNLYTMETEGVDQEMNLVYSKLESQATAGSLLPGAVVTEGLWQTLNAACDLLEEAASKGPPANGKPIVISLQSEHEAFASQKELRQRWRSLLIRVVDKGWNVMHMRRSPTDSKQVVDSIRYIIRNLLGRNGQYEPYYVSSTEDGGETAPVVPEMLIVPGCGALLFLASYQPNYIDSAVRLQAEAQDLLQQAFTTRKAHLTRLLQVFPRGSLARDSLTFEAVLARKEASILGPILVNKDGLSTTLVPLSVLRALINRRIAQEHFDSQVEEEQRRTALEFLFLEREDRRRRFFARLKTDKVLHIAHKNKLMNLLDKGQVSKDDWFLNTCPAPPGTTDRLLSPVEVVTCLRRLTEVIEKYPNYELRLVEDDSRAENIELFMEIIGSDIALFEALHTKDNNRQVDLAILEPRAIQALCNDFFKLWDQLSPDRVAVLEWISAQIKKNERL
jgi:transcriptional regulator with XRE-family HTH domain